MTLSKFLSIIVTFPIKNQLFIVTSATLKIMIYVTFPTFSMTKVQHFFIPTSETSFFTDLNKSVSCQISTYFPRIEQISLRIVQILLRIERTNLFHLTYLCYPREIPLKSYDHWTKLICFICVKFHYREQQEWSMKILHFQKTSGNPLACQSPDGYRITAKKCYVCWIYLSASILSLYIIEPIDCCRIRNIIIYIGAYKTLFLVCMLLWQNTTASSMPYSCWLNKLFRAWCRL